MRSQLFQRSRLAVPAGMLSVALLTACGGGSGDVESGGESVDLTYAFFAPENTFPAVQAQEWADRLQEETDSDVNVEMFFGGTLLESGDIYDGVTEGAADVGLDAPGYDLGRFPVSSVVTLPLDFENAQVASHTYASILEEYEPEEFDGYEIVAAFTTEPAHVMTIDPVESMDDMDGLELRGTGAQVPALEALGASAVGMPMPEVPEAVETGAVEGYSSSRETLQDFSLAEQVGYVSDYNFGISSTFVAVMDSDRFGELPEDVQQAIQDLRPEMTTFAAQYHDEENVAPAMEWSQDEHGLEVVELDDDEREAWDEELSGLVDDWVDEVEHDDPEALLERAEELRDEYTEEYGSE